MKTRELVSNALMITLLIVSAQITIPMQPVPLTLQTLVVMMMGCLLSPKNAFLSILGYIILALAGLPIFAGFSGGLSSILSPSFGFILSWLVAAPAQASLLKKLKKQAWSHYFSSCCLNFILTYTIGLPYMAFILNIYLGQGMAIGQILMLGFIPFILGDFLKMLAASFISWRLSPTIRVD